MLMALAETSLVTIPSFVERAESICQSAEFWVGIAFILVVALLFSPVSKILKSMAFQRIERIKTEISEAENLKLDAQKLYAEYERKFINTENEVSEIIENKKNFINQTKNKKIDELDRLLKHKQAMAETKIEQQYKQKRDEINKLVSQKTFAILENCLKNKLTKSDYNKLIDESINNINNLEVN